MSTIKNEPFIIEDIREYIHLPEQKKSKRAWELYYKYGVELEICWNKHFSNNLPDLLELLLVLGWDILLRRMEAFCLSVKKENIIPIKNAKPNDMTISIDTFVQLKRGEHNFLRFTKPLTETYPHVDLELCWLGRYPKHFDPLMYFWISLWPKEREERILSYLYTKRPHLKKLALAG